MLAAQEEREPGSDDGDPTPVWAKHGGAVRALGGSRAPYVDVDGRPREPTEAEAGGAAGADPDGKKEAKKEDGE